MICLYDKPISITFGSNNCQFFYESKSKITQQDILVRNLFRKKNLFVAQSCIYFEKKIVSNYKRPDMNILSNIITQPRQQIVILNFLTQIYSDQINLE